MKTSTRTNWMKTFALLVVCGFGILPLLEADVLVLQSGALVSGKILQQGTNGILLQSTAGTYRYPAASVIGLKIEEATAPHVSNNGQVIPDWAQIVTSLANSGFAPAIQQVPATVIGYGTFKNVPYISFRCGYGDYEINIFGDLNKPAAVQIGAMNYQHQTAAEKTNCVNFLCSILASEADRKLVRTLDWTKKDVQSNGGMKFETLLPGEMGSYGGWWISAYDTNALAQAQASDAELLAITLPRTTVVPSPVTAQPLTNVPAVSPVPASSTPTGIYSYPTYGVDSGWTVEEIAAAHPNAETATGANVYPRTYTRTAGTYNHYRR